MKRKLLTSLSCLLFIIVFNFALPRLMPGDTVLMLVGMNEDAVTKNEYQYYLEKTGADRPVLAQFGSYLTDILSGNLGYSYHYNKTVSELVGQRLPNTLQIAVPAVILSSLFSMVLGCYMGMRKGGLLDGTVTVLQIVADAIPGFLLALLMLLLFAFKLKWLPSGALNSIKMPPGALPALLDRLRHLILPIAVIVIGSTPGKYLMVYNLVAKQRGEKYVLYARARGMSNTQIAFRHIFPNICTPFIAMVGMNIGFVVSGSLIVEMIFSIDGMGSLLSQAITARDYPVLQGCLFVSALVVVIANLLTDVLCEAVDPRVRLKVHEAE